MSDSASVVMLVIVAFMAYYLYKNNLSQTPTAPTSTTSPATAPTSTTPTVQMLATFTEHRGAVIPNGVPNAGQDGLPLIKLQQKNKVFWTLYAPLPPQAFDLAKWLPQSFNPGDGGVVLRDVKDMTGGRGSIVWCMDKWPVDGFTITIFISYSVAWPRVEGKHYGDHMNITLFGKDRVNPDTDGLRFMFDEFNKKIAIKYNGKEITSATMVDFTDPNLTANVSVTVQANATQAKMAFYRNQSLENVVIPNFGAPSVLGPLVTIFAWSGGATDTFLIKFIDASVTPL